MNFTNSNLYLLFASFSPDELKELHKVLHSPFFNYREEEIRLYSYLLKIRKTKTTIPSTDEICRHVFPKQKPDIVKLRHVMSYLLRIMNRYIAISELENTEDLKRLLLLRSQRRRDLSKSFVTNYKETSHYYDEEAKLSPDLYYYQFQLHTEYYTHSITNRRTPNEELRRLTEDLDSFYAIQKLKQLCSVLSYRNIFKDGKSDEMAQDVIELIEKKGLKDNPLVSLLYQNYLCLLEPQNEAHFVRLKELLLTRSDRIETRELKDIFTLAINYCIKQLNSGVQGYYDEVFDIYEAGLERGVFEENNKLSAFTYKNISAIAIGLKKHDWVKGFLEQYRPKLDEEVRDGFYAYCMARYYFAVGEYATVSQLLQQVDIKEQFTDLDARVLLIKTYYELDEYDLLDYSIGNLKQQLKRKKLQSYHQSVYGNFVKSLSKLMHLRPYDKKAKSEYILKLKEIKAVAEKEWLLAKVKEK